ncbi:MULTISPECIES: hypothetical protein [Gordonia]|jgi:hypothetical protein|uniref:Ferredoxin n=1 Tax=Gordonia malaquae NBRC 108250 TaxID=1223542 RepID=M3VF96_GORML|nr:hypothetical protein [Gordonia malaquae]GAC79914.1 hypothetical protein GM1_013_00490 [Gordonia malaquae NBRC 108250]SEB80567.1 hypothetical protein SAMN04488550_0828 [Gordonia malaquae]
MHEISCGTCTNRVLVEKFSPTHTSVQWLDDSENACPEFAERVARGEKTQNIPTCLALRDAIEKAVHDGKLGTADLRREPVPGLIG